MYSQKNKVLTIFLRFSKVSLSTSFIKFNEKKIILTSQIILESNFVKIKFSSNKSQKLHDMTRTF